MLNQVEDTRLSLSAQQHPREHRGHRVLPKTALPLVQQCPGRALGLGTAPPAPPAAPRAPPCPPGLLLVPLGSPSWQAQPSTDRGFPRSLDTNVFDQRFEVCRNPADFGDPRRIYAFGEWRWDTTQKLRTPSRRKDAAVTHKVLSFPKISLPRPRHDLHGLLPPAAALTTPPLPPRRGLPGRAGGCGGFHGAGLGRAVSRAGLERWRNQENISLAPQQFVHPSGCLDRLFTSCPSIHHPCTHPKIPPPVQLCINLSIC